MFGNYKKALQEEYAKNIVLQDKLSKAKNRLKDLEQFIFWLNQECDRKGAAFVRIKKFQVRNREEYIGFLAYASRQGIGQVPEKIHYYYIIGYLCTGHSTPRAVYRANLECIYKDDVREIAANSCLCIEMHYVKDDSLRGYGIGSAGIAAIKDLAYQLHCPKVQGLSHVITSAKTEEELQAEQEKLDRFYEKNGFEKSSKTDHIEFNMEKYVRIDTIPSPEPEEPATEEQEAMQADTNTKY